MSKLKGCRPSKTVIQELSNAFAEYGAARHRMDISLPKEITNLANRLDELRLELTESQAQEKAMKEKESTQPSLAEVTQ